VAAAPARVTLSSSQASALVERLNSSERTTRLAAGQEVADTLRETNDPEILRALVDQLQPPKAGQLSSSGRFNMLYMLNGSEGWEAAGISDDLGQALSNLNTSGKFGATSQTGDCIAKLERRLAGNEDTPRTCGGL